VWCSCRHIICPNVVLTTTITGPRRAQIFACDSDMKLKQPVPICSAIFRLWLGGGVYQRSFAKIYLLAKCFTIICRVHELKRTSWKVTRISMEEVCPDRAIQAVHLTMRWGLLLCSSPVLKILLKAKIKLQYKQNITLENQRQWTPSDQTRLKNKRLPQQPALKLPFQIQIIQKSSTLASRWVLVQEWEIPRENVSSKIDIHHIQPAISLPAHQCAASRAYKLRTLANPSICPVFSLVLVLAWFAIPIYHRFPVSVWGVVWFHQRPPLSPSLSVSLCSRSFAKSVDKVSICIYLSNLLASACSCVGLWFPFTIYFH
jgi:hypothetical protein